MTIKLKLCGVLIVLLTSILTHAQSHAIINVKANQTLEQTEYDIVYRKGKDVWWAQADIKAGDMISFQSETERLFKDVFDLDVNVQYRGGTYSWNPKKFTIDPKFLLIHNEKVVNVISIRQYLNAAVIEARFGSIYGRLIHETLENIKRNVKFPTPISK
tara:strand:+ start:2634 stop:3110 length:477 start_codon:yes stop_codon:yes gene_type:complete